MRERRIGSAMTAAAICAAAFAVLLPRATDAGAVLVAQDDPVRLADLQLESVLRNDPALIGRNIEAALAAQDPDLAHSFVDLAEAKGISIPRDLTQRVTEAAEEENSTKAVARRFFSGLVTGNAVDGASLSGTLAGDLCVFGDVRDIVREGSHLAKGEDTDRLLLGLAVAGVAVTGATFVTVGGAAPARVGLTLVKDARKAGRLGEGLRRWAGRSAREMVDMRQLKKAFAAGSLAQPRQTAVAIKAAVRAEKAGGLVRLAKDVGRISEKTGTRGALDILRIAQGPKDVARAARLAKATGGQTRAIIKILGRGALLLTAGAFNLTMWVFSAALALFGFLSSIKAATERMTRSSLQRSRARRLRRLSAVSSPA